VIFTSLSREELREIVRLQLERLNRTLAARRIRIQAAPEAEAELLRIGYDPDYGARPLRRAVQREVQNRLARMILAREVRDGDELRLEVGEDGKLRLHVETRPAEPA